MDHAQSTDQSETVPPHWPILVVLFFSGCAGLINQVVWQRALKVYLGGSEALSSMTVVLVFLLGLGFGSWLLSRRVHRYRRPQRFLCGIEAGLSGVNFCIAWLLSRDLSDSVFAFQQAALAVGLPLRLTYAVVALLILGVPCVLMGMTVPLAAEICQRRRDGSAQGTISLLFFVNTAGAVVGTLGSGFLLLPYFGQFASLTVAATANGVAALTVARGLSPSDQLRAPVESAMPAPASWRPVGDDWLGLVLGLLSLGFEMYLFRVMSLLYWPLPYTFATTLCLFLVFWSAGVFASSKWRGKAVAHALTAALLLGAIPLLYDLHRWNMADSLGKYALGLLYFTPCFFFGSLYGQIVSRRAVAWGHDVGLFSAMNTVGSCLGIVLFTLLGYEIDVQLNVWVIAVGMIGVSAAAHLAGEQRESAASAAAADTVSSARPSVLIRLVPWGTAILMAVLVTCGQGVRCTIQPNGIRSYFGKDGVVELRSDNTMIWDGLEHSRLCDGEEYIGDNNWFMGTVPVMCHRGPIKDVLVIGLGCGTTVHTLAGLEGAEIDVYDINGTLRRVLEDHPHGTFQLGQHPRVHIQWRDGRTGLALNPKQYDVITQQPLYLMQAGSGILLSKEYFELVRSRLKPGGVFCAYTYDLENGVQSLIVRQTAQSVFTHCESFWNGWMIVASDEPLDLDPNRWQAKRRRPDRLYSEIRRFDEVAGLIGRQTVLRSFDRKRINWDANGLMVTDNHPIVEYPGAARRLLRPIQMRPELQAVVH